MNKLENEYKYEKSVNEKRGLTVTSAPNRILDIQNTINIESTFQDENKYKYINMWALE